MIRRLMLRRSLAALIVLGAAVLIWVGLIAPVSGVFKALEERRAAAHELIVRLNGTTLTAQQEPADTVEAALWQGNPAQVNAAILGAIARQAEAASVTLNATIPQNPEMHGDVQIVAVLVEASGRYGDIIALIDRLDGLSEPITTSTLSIRQQPRSGAVALDVVTVQIRFRALAEVVG